MATLEVDELKRAHAQMWAAGDYAAVSDAITDAFVPELLLARVPPLGEVLDVATGTGNVALKAAVAGATTTGLDLTPELLETARGRAAELGVSVTWVEGDAEALPFTDASFDRVYSAFGIQFAPRHAVVAAELLRVCRPGGAVVLANWTPEGVIGDLFRIMGRYLPKPPPFVSPPALWGSEAHVRELFDGAALEFQRETTPLRFASVEHYISFNETYYGPTIKARERLTEEGSWAACRREIVDMVEARNEATDGSLLVPAEYLVVIARNEG